MGHRNRKPKGKRLVVGLVLTAIFILFITCVAKLPTINVLLQEILSPGQSASTEYGWNLILVNQDYKVPKDWDIELTELSNGQSVDSRIYPDLQQMFDDMRAQGVYPVVASGYRTAEKQQELMDEKIDELKDAKRRIEAIGGHVAGVVLNRTKLTKKKYENSYYSSSIELTTMKSDASRRRFVEKEDDEVDKDEKAQEILEEIKRYNKGRRAK